MRDLLVILVVVLLVFGAKKLRTLGSDLGAAVKGFKKGMSGIDRQAAAQVSPSAPDAEFPELSQPQERSDREST